jgi:hypothetical protein
MLTLMTPSCKQLRGQRTLLTRKTQEEFSNVQQQKDNEVCIALYSCSDTHNTKHLTICDMDKLTVEPCSDWFSVLAIGMLPHYPMY